MFKNSPIICIDIGSSKIATLIASQSDESEAIHVIGAATSESRGVKKSQVVDIEEAIGAIQESVEAAERMAGLSVNKAYISVGGNHIKSRNSTGVVAVAQPEGEITNDDVNRVIEAARAVSLSSAEEIIHVLPRSYKVDSQEGVKDPVGMTGVRLEAEAHLVTGSSTAMRNMTKCVTELGINPQGMIFSGLASSESVLTPTEKELGVVLVDIGGGTTSIAIWIEGALSHSAVLPIGARNITNDLAIGMRQSLDIAEKVKCYLSKIPKKPALPDEPRRREVKTRHRRHDEINLAKVGITSESTKYSRKTLVEGIIKPRLQEIFNMVGTELRDSGFGGQTPAGVVLTGGGAKTVGIEEACKRTLSLPTRVGIPHTLTGLIDDIRDPGYSATEGLVLYVVRFGDVAERSAGPQPQIGRLVQKLPVKGTVNKAVDFLKQFLP
jgi:cell division protein FtsA